MTQDSKYEALFQDHKGFTAKQYAELLERFKEVAVEIGHIAFAWNNIHVTLGDIFVDLLRSQVPGSAKALWDTLRSDRAQRDAITVVAKLALTAHQKHLDDLMWLLAAVEALSADRNDPIHAAYMFKAIGTAKFSVIPHPRSEAKRHQRMKDKALLEEFRLYRDELHALRIFAIALETQINNAIFNRGLAPAWPKRPPVRSSEKTQNRGAANREGGAE